MKRNKGEGVRGGGRGEESGVGGGEKEGGGEREGEETAK